MALFARMHRLAAKYRFVPPERCRGGTTVIVDAGDEVDLTNAPWCPHCRQPHVSIIEEVIVEANTIL